MDVPESAPESNRKKLTSSVQDIGEERAPFGSRFLTDEEDVWSQNAWDHVPPPEDQAETIAQSLLKQRSNPVPTEEKQNYNEKPAKHWDNFYKMNANNFFRNRKWLHNEFPELVAATKANAGQMCITEVGCGAGNSVFPLLSANQNPALQLRAYDYASHAVKLVQNDPLYASPPVGSIHASVWDVTSPNGLPPDLAPGTVDIVILVFVMSALHPDEWGRAIANIVTMLKPGGVVLFRDYGRYDLTQLRFKGGRLLDENFYIRGDKTRVYFFELDELSLLFTGAKVSSTQTTTTTTQIDSPDEDGGDAGEYIPLPDSDVESTVAQMELDGASANPDQHLSDFADTLSPHIMNNTPDSISDTICATRPAGAAISTPSSSTASTSIHHNLLSPDGLANCPPHPLFTAEQLGIDRRLIVNRKRQLKMYRVWMQGRFLKL